MNDKYTLWFIIGNYCSVQSYTGHGRKKYRLILWNISGVKGLIKIAKLLLEQILYCKSSELKYIQNEFNLLHPKLDPKTLSGRFHNSYINVAINHDFLSFVQQHFFLSFWPF